MCIRDRSCPACGHLIELFKSGGGEKLAQSAGVRFLGSIPIDPQIVDCGDSGKPFAGEPATSPTADAFARAIEPILAIDMPIEVRSTATPAGKRKAV